MSPSAIASCAGYALRPERGLTELFFAWPGVEFTCEGTTVDIDLLVSNGETVWCVEAKNNAH